MQNIHPPEIFDRRQIRIHRERAWRMAQTRGGHPLIESLAEEMAERVQGIKREFLNVLELGGIGTTSVSCRLPFNASRCVTICGLPASNSEREERSKQPHRHVFADEEALPFAEGSFDLIISLLSIPWINDIPRHLTELKRLLRPGGLLMAALAGGETLSEFRSCLVEAELACRCGAGSRFSPMIDMSSVSHLMARAGFQLPVVDRETCALAYPDAFALVRDLRRLGHTSAHHAKAREWLPLKIFLEAEKLCMAHNEDKLSPNRLIVKAELFFLHGWRQDS